MTLEVLCGHCLNYCLCCVYWIFRTYTSCESNSFQMPKMTLKLYPKRPLGHTVQIYSEPCTTNMALWHILMGHESIDMQYILDIHIMQFISNSDNQVHSCLPKFNHFLVIFNAICIHYQVIFFLAFFTVKCEIIANEQHFIKLS